MNFLIFSDFSGFIFDLNILKTIKNIKKGFNFARDPRGCNVACKATWQSHAGPRKRLRGAEVTRGMLFIYTRNIRFIIHISLPIIGR